MGRIFIHDLEIIFILSYKGQNLSKAHQEDNFMEQIWADFGPVGNTEKNIWADYEQL